MKVINNAHALEVTDYDGRPLYDGAYLGNDLYRLSNERVIKSLGDGRYIDTDNDLDQYAEVTDIYKATGKSKFLGWVKV